MSQPQSYLAALKTPAPAYQPPHKRGATRDPEPPRAPQKSNPVDFPSLGAARSDPTPPTPNNTPSGSSWASLAAQQPQVQPRSEPEKPVLVRQNGRTLTDYRAPAKPTRRGAIQGCPSRPEKQHSLLTDEEWREFHQVELPRVEANDTPDRSSPETSDHEDDPEEEWVRGLDEPESRQRLYFKHGESY